MVLVNYTTRELTAKLVYYGPGLCGKTTNLQYVYETLLPPDRRGKMVSLATETDRTLFFDFLPLDIGSIRGLKTRLQLYTVPGQVHYNATRKIVLKGADGIVFVADSQRSMKQANIESFKNMRENLIEHGLELKDIPHVIQFNKRDLPDVMPIEEMFEDLNEHNAPFWEAVAVQGVGVEDTLKSVTKLVLKSLATKFAPEGAAAAEATPPPAKPAAPIAEPVAAEPMAAEPFEAPAAEPAAAEASPFGEEPAPARRESSLMTSTGELLALEFDGGGGTPVPPDEDEILEVGEDALLLEDEPTSRRPVLAEPEESPFGATEAEDLEASPAAGGPFGEEETIRPEALVADDAASALDGLELGTPLAGLEPGPAPPRPAVAEAEPVADGGETVVMPSEVAPQDLEMPGLDGGSAGGDTVLSPVGELEGLATEADMHVPSSGLDDIPLLDDIPEVPGMEGPPQRMPQERAPELPQGPPVFEPEPEVEPEPPIEEEMAALASSHDEAVEITTLSLGQVQGEILKTLHVPIEWTDASGQSRSRLLEVKLRFKLD